MIPSALATESSGSGETSTEFSASSANSAERERCLTSSMRICSPVQIM